MLFKKSHLGEYGAEVWRRAGQARVFASFGAKRIYLRDVESASQAAHDLVARVERETR